MRSTVTPIGGGSRSRKDPPARAGAASVGKSESSRISPRLLPPPRTEPRAAPRHLPDRREGSRGSLLGQTRGQFGPSPRAHDPRGCVPTRSFGLLPDETLPARVIGGQTRGIDLERRPYFDNHRCTAKDGTQRQSAPDRTSRAHCGGRSGRRGRTRVACPESVSAHRRAGGAAQRLRWRPRDNRRERLLPALCMVGSPSPEERHAVNHGSEAPAANRDEETGDHDARHMALMMLLCCVPMIAIIVFAIATR